MTRTIDTPSFELSLVRYCSPTLAGLKPAALFTFSGVYAAEANACGDEKAEIVRRRAALLDVIARCEATLAHAGIRIRVLVWRACGALVYVYRPNALHEHLADKQALEQLASQGYDASDLDGCITRLADRIALASKHHAETVTIGSCDLDTACDRNCGCAFPHEIGFFLGYPTDDVLGFIAHEGRDYLAVGPWKVYTHLEQALATFERYRRCTETYSRVYQRGCCLARLARA